MDSFDLDTTETVRLRPPEVVMQLDRLGAMHQTRLSFLRATLRQFHDEGWRIGATRWNIEPDGVGVAVYAAEGAERTYSLVCFSHDLDPSQRTDRVIAEAWDATFTLFDGVPTRDDIVRLAANTPKQEAGRYRDSDLILSRVNRSSRLFDYVVDELAAGRQPDPARLDDVGYLMRTTAVYGNGKFGLADRDRIAARPEFAGPFRAEMLTVWMIRAFTTDLAEYLAEVRAPGAAVRLDRDLRRQLGVGNATASGSGRSSSTIRRCSTAGLPRARPRWPGSATSRKPRPRLRPASAYSWPAPRRTSPPGGSMTRFSRRRLRRSKKTSA